MDFCEAFHTFTGNGQSLGVINFYRWATLVRWKDWLITR